MKLNSIIEAARGAKPVDLLLTNARMVNVFNGEIETGSLAVAAGYFVGLGDYPAEKSIDLQGRYVVPGFIDSHVHIESSMTCINEFARAVLVRGTTTVVADPHEIANVLGTAGIDYMLESAENQPMNIYFSLPSCVPATDMETAGARLGPEELAPYFAKERIVALAEMMNFPGVIFADPEVLSKIELAHSSRKPIDGHAPGLSGKELSAYLSSGISSDHECTTVEEAKEKLAAGMHIMVREGTCARNLDQLFPLINGKTYRRIMWCTDDRHPHDLIEDGHIDTIVRSAIGKGLDPVTAIQMATINPAEYFGLSQLGAIAPGRQADFLVTKNLDTLEIEEVFCRGVSVAKDSRMRAEIARPDAIQISPAMDLKPANVSFKIPVGGDSVRVIEVVPDQVITTQRIEKVNAKNGQLMTDIDCDILKIAVVERYSGKGGTGYGLVKGMGLKKGALASSVAHDSHNIIVTGTNDDDMLAALTTVVEMGGGLAAACNGVAVASLPLPVAGLMSFDPVDSVRRQMDQMIRAARDMGSTLSDPFMTLCFLALPVIPELKITDKGLIDINKFEIVPLFV